MRIRWRYALGEHPPACTCVRCNDSRLASLQASRGPGRPVQAPRGPDRPVQAPSSYGRPRGRPNIFRWLILALIAIAAAFVIVLMLPQCSVDQLWETLTGRRPPAPATQAVRPDMRHLEEKQYMLDLINADRVLAGVPPVVLGDNVAAQLHAESAIEHCFSSHWGVDGLKPYMRYTLAGGHQSNGENISGHDYCASWRDGFSVGSSPEQQLTEAMEGLMDSPDHRRNTLYPHHRRVNLGLAWDSHSFYVVQHFEGDYVGYEQLPNIEGGVLSMTGSVRNGVSISGDGDLGVQVFYDPPPHALTTGQLARTYCYDQGLMVAALRAPPEEGWFYDEDAFDVTRSPCPDPYAVPADASPPDSPEEASSLWDAAYRASQLPEQKVGTAPWITALDWNADGDAFSVRADVGDLLSTHGEGVYTVLVWGSIEGDDVTISQYSIFHGVPTPEGYGVYAEALVQRKSTPAPTLTPTALPESSRNPSPTPTALPVPTSTARPQDVRPDLRHLEEKQYMLELINTERVRAGVPPVTLGDNVAAQLHAESAFENCFFSHWGVDGLKPYMRYSLAGGHQSNGENVFDLSYTLIGGNQSSTEKASGLSYCNTALDGHSPPPSPRQEIREAMEGLMASPGHRDTILDRHYRRVNIGIVWDRYNFKVIQHFEGDYVRYDLLPNITAGVFSMSGSVRNGVSISGDGLAVQVFYDQPPRALTAGQLARTYCYDQGLIVASLRPPLERGWFYTEDTFNVTSSPCPDPYAVPADASPPGSPAEASSLWNAAYRASQRPEETIGTAPWITALGWSVDGDAFSVRADIGDLLSTHGEGVYTVTVWGSIDGEQLVISQYSIFHGVATPDGYDVYAEALVQRKPTPAPTPTATPVPTPTATATPTATPVPTPTAMATPTATPVPTPTATATAVPESRPRRTPTATPTVTPTAADPDRPDLRHLDQKRNVLGLINKLRIAVGMDPLVLGENVAAQLHAEAMLAGCFASHWGPDGLKPHMRFALAGGSQLSREDVSGLSHCHTDAGSLPPYDDLRAKIELSLGQLIGSREPWPNVRRESHDAVSIGLAWNRYQVFLVLQYEEDYIASLGEATIRNGHLNLRARVSGEVTFGHDRDLAIEIVYDPPPRALSRGQLARTSCYDLGRRIAAIRATPLGGEGHYLESYSVLHESCPDPHRIPASSPPPGSARDARNFHSEAEDARMNASTAVHYLNADRWLVDEHSFSIRAQIDELLATWGAGIYTVLVYGPVDGDRTLILEHPIFYRTARPATYAEW